MEVTFYLRVCKATFLMSTPSIKILPVSTSRILKSVNARVDLPAPVLPTTPTLVPGLKLTLRPFRTSSVEGLYLRETF